MLRSASLLLFLLTTVSLLAKKGESIFDRWSTMDHKTLEFRINLDSLEAHRYSEEAIRATVIDNGQAFTLDVTVRGRFRRRSCSLPPMLLQFDKDRLRLAGLNTHNDYKLVTPCTKDRAGQDAILREELAYELYRTVNPEASFRTKLLTIHYVNTADGSTTTSYAILIEDTDELQHRLRGDNCQDCFNRPLTEYANAEEVTLFQYMIGNADFSTRMGRNLKQLRTEDDLLTAVPYDFDYSGLVDPTYANSPLRERHLVWEFDTAADLSKATTHFLTLEHELLQVVEDYEPLDRSSKRDITKYLRSFFRELKGGAVAG